MSTCRWLLASLVVLGAATGCDGTGATPTHPHLLIPRNGADGLEEVEAGEHYHLHFGAVRVGGARTIEFPVRNSGAATLDVRDLTIEGVDGAGFEVERSKLSVAPGSSGTLAVTFRPDAKGASSARFSFSTNDEEARHVRVDLSGKGVTSTVEIVPSRLDFGRVVVGSTESMTLLISSVGEDQACLELGGIVPDAGQASFSVGEGTQAGPVTIAPGDSWPLELRFQPGSQGAVAAQLRLLPCDGSPTIDVPLAGEGIRTGLVVEPDLVDFGYAPPGHFAIRSVRFSNVGNLPIQLKNLSLRGLDIGAVADPAFSVDPLSLPITLEPSSQQDVQLRFAPQDTESHAAALSWRTDDPTSPSGQTWLFGDGGGGSLETTPDEVLFGPVAIGIVSRRAVLLSNTGPDPLTLRSLRLEGDSAFALADMPDGSVVLEPGERHELTLTFAPKVEATSTGRLVIESDDFFQPEAEVPLAGSGLDLPACALEVSPEQLNFGMVKPGERLTLAITLTNVLAEGDCLIRDISLTPESPSAFELIDAPLDPMLVGPGETRVLHVGFTAGESSTYGGAVTMQVSDPAQPERTVALEGWTLGRNLEVVPRTVDFGTVGPPCGIASREICVVNHYPLPVTVSGISIGEAPQGFGVRTGAGGFADEAVTLQREGRACAVVDFRPERIGAYASTAQIGLEGYPAPLVASLSGTGSSEVGAGDGETCLQGRVVTASGTYGVPGATVSSTVTDLEGQLRTLQAQTDCGGFFYLTGVPPGSAWLDVTVQSYGASAQVNVESGVTLLRPPMRLDAATPAVAAIRGSYDYADEAFEPLLGATNVSLIGYEFPDGWQEQKALLEDLAALQEYDVLLLSYGMFDPPSSGSLGSELANQNVRSFVAEGGTLYLSHGSLLTLGYLWPEVFTVDPFAERMPFPDPPIQLDDAVWAACLPADVRLGNGGLGRLFPVLEPSHPDVEILMSTDLSTADGVVKHVPLAGTFRYGQGEVVFHQGGIVLDLEEYPPSTRQLWAYLLLRL